MPLARELPKSLTGVRGLDERSRAAGCREDGPRETLHSAEEPYRNLVEQMQKGAVLTNIVTNAVKYTPPGGRIRVALRADGSDAVLSVEDTGFGISPRLLPWSTTRPTASAASNC